MSMDWTDDDLDVLESISDYEDDDLGEARRRRPPTSRGGGYSRPRLADGGVSQPQLQAALSRVGKDMQRNAAGVRALEADLTRQKKELAAEIKKARDFALIAPLLLQPAPATGGQPAPAGALGSLLPLILLMNGQGCKDNSSTLLLALSLSGGLRPGQPTNF
jgi:hypothetical protein